MFTIASLYGLFVTAGLCNIGEAAKVKLGMNAKDKIVIFGKQIDLLEEDSHKTKTNHQRFFEDNDYFYIPIRKLEESDYEGFCKHIEAWDELGISYGLSDLRNLAIK